MARMDRDALKAQIRREMEMAQDSRLEGQEGRARVCARRAAGWAVSILLAGGNTLDELGNAYKSLLWFQQQKTVTQAIRDTAIRLTTRLTPDHRQPFDEDPLLDAERVITYVFHQDWREFPGSVDGEKEDSTEEPVE